MKKYLALLTLSILLCSHTRPLIHIMRDVYDNYRQQPTTNFWIVIHDGYDLAFINLKHKVIGPDVCLVSNMDPPHDTKLLIRQDGRTNMPEWIIVTNYRKGVK